MLVALSGITATEAQAGPVSAFPSPGTPTALRATEISLRGVAPDGVGAMIVTGSRSGRHEGTLEPHPDGRGASFVPHRRFRPGERVTVRTRLDVRGGREGDFRFRIARGDFEVGTINAEKRLPRLRGSYRSYRSTRLKAPRLRVLRRRAGRAPGYLVLNTGWDDERPRPEGALIADDRGQPVWFLSRRPGRKVFDVAVQRYRGEPVITYWEGRFAAGWGYGTYVVLDRTYRQIARIRALGGNRADIHDMQLTEEGTALVASYNLVRRNGPVLDNVIQEIDVATGRLLFEWHSVGNVALSESRDRRERGEMFDYFHLNSVEVAPDGDVLVSARNTCALYEIDRGTGAINWRLGGRRSDFRLGEGVRFCRQHDARWADDGVITLFDNRIAAPTEPGQSRAIKLAVDERRRRVSLLRGYKHPAELGAPNKGGARMQPNGNLLVAWGAVAGRDRVHAARRHRVRRPVRGRPGRLLPREPRGLDRAAGDATRCGGTAARRPRRGVGELERGHRGRALGGARRRRAGRARPGGLRAAVRLRDRAQRPRIALRGGARARRRRDGRRAPPQPSRLSLCAVWVQREITLRPRPRGFHLVTDEVVSALPELRELRVGLAHLFILHTSASLTLNENASPDVRRDFESYFNEAVPEDAPYWTHTIEGPGRHAGPHQGLAARPGALAAGQPRPARARDLAGDLPVRAPRPRRRAVARRDAVRGVAAGRTSAGWEAADFGRAEGAWRFCVA